MNLRYGWWLAGALLCVSALGVQRARADEIGAAPGSIRATRPPTPAAPATPGRHAPTAVAEPLARAEALYRSGSGVAASEAFEAVLAVDPGNPRAWLRIGNLRQAGGDDAGAIEAYRNAAAAVARSDAESEARGKALLNLAQHAIDEASRAIDAVDALRLPSLRAARDRVAPRLGAQRHRLRRSVEPTPEAGGRIPPPADARADRTSGPAGTGEDPP